jgi:hypothetical protein
VSPLRPQVFGDLAPGPGSERSRPGEAEEEEADAAAGLAAAAAGVVESALRHGSLEGELAACSDLSRHLPALLAAALRCPAVARRLAASGAARPLAALFRGPHFSPTPASPAAAAAAAERALPALEAAAGVEALRPGLRAAGLVRWLEDLERRAAPASPPLAARLRVP